MNRRNQMCYCATVSTVITMETGEIPKGWLRRNKNPGREELGFSPPRREHSEREPARETEAAARAAALDSEPFLDPRLTIVVRSADE